MKVFKLFKFLVGSSLLLFFVNKQIQAQSDKAIYFEAFGNGILYSLNYDQRFSIKNKDLGARLGFSYMPLDGSNFITIPFHLYYLLGKNGNYLELGSGLTYFDGNAYFIGDYSYDSSFALALSAMYRRQPLDGGFLFRIGINSIFSDKLGAPIWAGLSIGYAF